MILFRFLIIILFVVVPITAQATDNDGDGWTIVSGDCDDTIATIYPGATESCDGIDNDCDGQIDEGVLTKYYPDNDEDQFGQNYDLFDLLWSSSETDETRSVALGDMDGDGDLDLAVGNENSSNQLYENDGAGNLTLVWSASEINATVRVAWGDMDGDGDLDLAVGNKGLQNNNNRLYENDGAGNMSLAWNSLESDRTHALAWGDMDGDGDLDLAVGNDNQPNRIYANNGSGNLTLYWSSPESDRTNDISWGDIDEDGDLDLVVGNWGEPSRLYRNDGTGSMTLFWSESETDLTHAVSWGDMDGDGDLDLVVGNYSAPDRLYQNDGSGNFVLFWSSASNPTTSIAWGDFDRDGDLDLARDYMLYQNDGLGNLTWVWSAQETDWTHSIAWGDMNGDGNLDLVAGKFYGANRVYINNSLFACSAPPRHVDDNTDCNDTDPNNFPGNQEICDGVDNNCDGQADEGLNIDADGDGHYLIGACGVPADDCDDTNSAINPDASEICDGIDNDCDGQVDEGVINTYYRDSDSDLYGDSLEIFDLIWSADATSRPMSLDVGDVDGDGDNDVVIGTRHASSTLYLNDGLGNLTNEWASNEMNNFAEVVLRDIDSDGDLDLIVGHAGGFDPLYIYFNDGTGQYGLPFNTSNRYSVRSLETADVDNDGDTDIIVGSPAHNAVLLNNGSAQFTAGWSSTESNQTDDIALGDVDGDGDLDIAFADIERARIYLNNGSGQYSLSANTLEEEPSNSVVLHDIDNNGTLDLVVGTRTGIQTYLNNGQGHFSLVWTSGDIPTGINDIALLDYDSDGDSDIIAVRFNTGSPRFFINNGQGYFSQTWVYSSTNGAATALMLADVNDDGLLDLLTTSPNDGLWVYLNTESIFYGCTQPPDHVINDLDCNDAEFDINPAATEAQCNGVDDDCNPLTLDDVDQDGDGYGACHDDCDDTELSVNPGVNEVCHNNRDDNCDGQVDEGCPIDSDGDGFFSLTTGGDDCDDTNVTINPDATEVCDGIDNNCDGQIDEGVLNTYYPDNDGDGFGSIISPFSISWSSTQPETTEHIAWGDSNDDGYLDLAVGNWGEPTRIYLNDTQGNFTEIWASNETDRTRSVVWVDADNDGDLDLATGSERNGARLYLNNGQNNFLLSWTSTETNFIFATSWSDIDNDGDADLTIANQNHPTRLYLNDGQGGFSLFWSSDEVGTSRGIVWGDIDNDHDLDLVVANRGGDFNYLYTNDGQGNLTLSWSFASSDNTSALFLGDADSDNDLDLFVANDGEPNRLYLNDGQGGFSLFWSSDELDPTNDLALGDFDRDGDPDLAVGNNYGVMNRLYLNDGLGNFTLWMSFSQLDHTFSLDWGDYDNDGDLDLAVGNVAANEPTVIYQNNLVLACTQPADHSSNNLDCNDAEFSINPDANEICNGMDDNCDGQTDEGCPIDADSDGFFSEATGGDDCDDINSAINPDATEICDGVDNNCDGQIDEGVLNTYYLDNDSDGFGDLDQLTEACTQPAGYVANSDDCDDSNSNWTTHCPIVVNITSDEPDFSSDGLCDIDGDESNGLQCSLRAALQEIDGHEIHFNIPGTGPHQISLTTELPTVSEPVVINGQTQPGYFDDPNLTIDNPIIWIDGGNTIDQFLTLSGNASGSVIKGLGIRSFDTAILIDSHGVLLENNHMINNSAYGVVGINANNLRISSNQIAHNSLDGIQLLGSRFASIDSNHITENGLRGVSIEPSASLPGECCDSEQNTISHNQIYNNGSLGIDISDTLALLPTININDQPDTDFLLNSPVIRGVTFNANNTISMKIGYDFGYALSDQFRLEFFLSDVEDPSGYGEGRVFLGEMITSPGVSISTPAFPMPAHALNYSVVTATATNITPGDPMEGSTSEFSRAFVDHDRDGYSALALDLWLLDCDDINVAINPGSAEILCDGIDNDCNLFTTDDEDIDNDDVSVCGVDGIIGTSDDDCDDLNGLRYPGNFEVCDLIDNDCDGDVDEGINIDGDGDGHYPIGSCNTPADDCDDNNAAVNPSLTEVCDLVDNNCDGQIDEGFTNLFYQDSDGDSFGDPAVFQMTCQRPTDYVSDNTDCDDSHSMVYPGAVELCDGIDNDCDSIIPPEEIDQDGDGQAICAGDCNDRSGTIFLGATEICDERDNDCNGLADFGAPEVNYRLEYSAQGSGDYAPLALNNPTALSDFSNPMADDSVSDLVPIGFDFNFYGQEYSSLYMSSNGWVSFSQPQHDGCCEGLALPYSTIVRDALMQYGTWKSNLIAFWWEDLQPDFGHDSWLSWVRGSSPSDEHTGVIQYQTVGSAPFRTFVLELNQIPHCCNGGDDRVSLQLHLKEYMNTIEIHYQYAPGDAVGGHTVGVLNEAGDTATTYLNSVTSPPAEIETRVRFIPESEEVCHGGRPSSGRPSSSDDLDNDGYSVIMGDCNDLDATTYPRAEELCDGIDNDCNGQIDEGIHYGSHALPNDGSRPLFYLDNDGDGFGTNDHYAAACEAPRGYVIQGDDCDDDDPMVYPRLLFPDRDGDGYSASIHRNSTMSLNNRRVRLPIDLPSLDLSGAITSCEHVPGYSDIPRDCNDANGQIYPEAPELCDGVDNDCDHRIDENILCKQR